VILLDHGLYRELDDEFRLNYANLWKAIISADEPKIKEFSEKMNAGNMYHLFASMLTLKP
jgi:aarF domain-containing kinase